MKVTDYKIRQAQIWMLQVRNRGSNEAWSPTGTSYFNTRKAVLEDIRNHTDPNNFKYLEYRPMRYVPAEFLKGNPK